MFIYLLQYVYIKVNVKLSLCLINWISTHEDILGTGAPLFLTAVLDEGERPASRPCRFTLGETAASTHYKGGWVGPRARLDFMEMRKIAGPSRESNPDSSVVQPVTW
jgi:hypothetical protein